MGATVANFVSRLSDWQTAYFIGGGLGLLLLIARISVFESGIFLKTKEKQVRRGDLMQLVSQRTRFVKFLGCIFIGLPIWYAIGILITFAPEFAAALGVPDVKTAGNAVMYSYLGLALGDLTSGLVSQMLGSRKKVVAVYLVATLFFILFYLFSPVKTTSFYYFTCFTLGCGIGYWALFVTIAAEQFGTNLRSTVATSVPNFIRGTVIPLTLLFKLLRDGLAAHYEPTLGADAAKSAGIIYGALIVGGFTIVIAFIALRVVDETFGRDLNYEETD
jgi:hypothetical protein